MLLRNTKKFFQKTIEGFKSFLSPGRGSASGGAGILCSYHRLPKTPSLINPFSSCGRRREELADMENEIKPDDPHNDTDSKDLNSKWEHQRSKPNKNQDDHHPAEDHKRKTVTFLDQSTSTTTQKIVMNKGVVDTNLKLHLQSSDGEDHEQGRRRKGGGEMIMEAEMSEIRHVRLCWIAQRLKEMEMVDKSNVDHLLDIEEVLYYYSRLTLPTYMDIVDKFLLELYSEFFGPQQHQFGMKNRGSSSTE